jgi:hypothetical protein
VEALRDLALILLALEAALGTLVVLAVIAAINYALFYFRWWRTLPRWFAIARGYLHQGRQAVEIGSRAVAAPIFTLEATWAGVKGAVKDLRSRQTR